MQYSSLHADGAVICIHIVLNITVQESQSYLLWEINDTADSALLLNQYKGSAKGVSRGFSRAKQMQYQPNLLLNWLKLFRWKGSLLVLLNLRKTF